MDASRWQEVKRLLDAALKLDASERRAFLDRSCPADSSIRATVESLLDAGERAHDMFENGSAPGMPDRIGPYVITRLLGSGGMGDVYLAEQAEPIRRKVALKVVRSGLATDSVLRRFDVERHALGLMTHPNIARVHDAGTTADHRAYFVMEYIDGDPITVYCDSARLGTRERLDLFRQVCFGVRHAHLKGVIHRDIKPSNVLVRIEDGVAVPVIIDFGIAKATGPAFDDLTKSTRLGQVIGTPEYMSPEQAAGSGDIDTRTDVYSLGVLLYELLAGQLPWTTGALDDFAKIRRSIEEFDPSSPSVMAEASAETAKRRGTNPRTLARELRGELDWITMKALAKNREQRYPGAAELADDLGRYLGGEAVLAGPPSVGYRVRRLVRRHRVAVSLTATMVVFILTGLVSSTYGLLRAKRAEASARREALLAQDTSEFMASMLADVNPQRAGRFLAQSLSRGIEGDPDGDPRPDDLHGWLQRIDMTGATVEFLDAEILGPAGNSIEDKARDNPALAGRLHLALSDTYRRIGLYERGLEHARRAVAVQSAHFGSENASTLEARNSEGLLMNALSRHDEAVEVLSDVLELRRRDLGAEDPDTLNSMNSLAIGLKDLGRFDEAETLNLAALDGRRKVLGPEHDDTLTSWNNLAVLYDTQGRYREAETLFVELLEVRRRVYGSIDPRTLSTMNNLGVLYQSLGRLEEAETYYLAASEGRRDALGDRHPHTLATLYNLANLYQESDRVDQAEELHRQVLDARRVELGDLHRETLQSMNSLATVLESQGQLVEAERMYRQTLEGQRRTLGSTHSDTLYSMANLAILVDGQGRAAEAKPLFLEVLETNRRQFGEQHPDTLQSRTNLGFYYWNHEQYDAAELQLELGWSAALEAYEAGNLDPDLLSWLAGVYAGFLRDIRQVVAEAEQVESVLDAALARN